MDRAAARPSGASVCSAVVRGRGPIRQTRAERVSRRGPGHVGAGSHRAACVSGVSALRRGCRRQLVFSCAFLTNPALPVSPIRRYQPRERPLPHHTAFDVPPPSRRSSKLGQAPNAGRKTLRPRLCLCPAVVPDTLTTSDTAPVNTAAKGRRRRRRSDMAPRECRRPRLASQDEELNRRVRRFGES